MHRDVHSLMLSIQHFLYRSRRRLPCRVPWRKVLERLSWGVTCPNHASFSLLTVARRVDPQGRWSCSAPSRWSCAPSRRCREVSSGIWFRRPGSFFKSRQAESTFHSHRRGRRWRETCRAGTYFAKLIVLNGQFLLSLAIAVIAEAILMRTSAVDIFVVIILVSMSYGILLLFFSMIINSFRSCSPLLIILFFGPLILIKIRCPHPFKSCLTYPTMHLRLPSRTVSKVWPPAYRRISGWNDVNVEHMLKVVFYNLGTELWPAFMCYSRGNGLIQGLIRGITHTVSQH